MMSLRSAIPDKDIPQHLPPPSEIAPLVVQFTNNCVPLSCFSRTISCLMAIYDWKLSRADDGSPKCLAHNVVSLYRPQTPSQIVLVDTGHTFQVHVRPEEGLDQDDMAEICFEIKDTIFTAIKQVFDRLNLSGIEATLAFVCPCEGKPLAHPASSYRFNFKWRLSCPVYKESKQTSKHHLMWLETPPTNTKRPTLEQLYGLKVPEEVGTNYRKLGTFLLNDESGCKIDVLEHDCFRQAHDVTMKILQNWLAGKGGPPTWQTLVESLRRCELNTLADKIQQKYLPQ
jgi:hypothetical protein